MVQSVFKLTTNSKSKPLLLQALRSLMAAARTDSGFISSSIYVDADNPNTLCYQEQWFSLKDIEAQIRSTRYTRLLNLMEMSAEPPIVEFHMLAETRGLDYLEAVRLERTHDVRPPRTAPMTDNSLQP